MRILGLDWGEARIGVAVSDPLNITAQPLLSIVNDSDLVANLKEIISKYGAEEIVIGLPRQLSGRSGASASRVRAFSEMISKEFPVKVSLWDERLTTKIALQAMAGSKISNKRKKAVVDASAAAVLLQGYMDSIKHADN